MAQNEPLFECCRLALDHARTGLEFRLAELRAAKAIVEDAHGLPKYARGFTPPTLVTYARACLAVCTLDQNLKDLERSASLKKLITKSPKISVDEKSGFEPFPDDCGGHSFEQ